MTTKTVLITLASTAILTITAFSLFGQADKKVSDARKDVASANKSVADANKALREAKIDSAADFKKFQDAARVTISDNKVKIAELKAKKANETKEVKQKYDAKVMELETRNNELNKRMEGAGMTDTSEWASFKREFNHDMTELGKAFMDFGKDNTK